MEIPSPSEEPPRSFCGVTLAPGRTTQARTRGTFSTSILLGLHPPRTKWHGQRRLTLNPSLSLSSPESRGRIILMDCHTGFHGWDLTACSDWLAGSLDASPRAPWALNRQIRRMPSEMHSKELSGSVSTNLELVLLWSHTSLGF